MPSWGKWLRQVNIIQFVDWTALKTIARSIRLGETEIKEFPLEELQDNVTVIDQRPFVIKHRFARIRH